MRRDNVKYVLANLFVVVLIGVATTWFWGSRVRKQSGLSRVSFRMPIEDAFALKERGRVVVVGIVADGEITPGARLLLRVGNNELPVTVEALEAHHQSLQVARQGDRIGILLAGVDKEQVGVGAVLLEKTD
jgi:translation elongation factor EF-Tu-like GTPase